MVDFTGLVYENSMVHRHSYVIDLYYRVYSHLSESTLIRIWAAALTLISEAGWT